MSLTAIRTAIRERLETLLSTADPPGPLAHVSAWAGETERSDAPGLDALGRTPAAMHAYAREIPTQTKLATTGELVQVLASLWTIFVVVRSVGEPGDATDALDETIDAVIDAVVGTQVTSVGAVPLALESVAPYRTRPGLFVYAVTLRASRVLSTRAAAGTTDEFQQFDGEVDPVDADAVTDAEALPLSTARAENLHD